MKPVVLAILIVSAVTAFSQPPAFKSIIEKFYKHRDNNLVEKIYAHLDRPNYLVGETMWFKLYYVDGAYNRPLNLSKIAYVEVLNDENIPVLQTKIYLNEEGSGNGSFVLPASLKSGHYNFRAYTNWMKNFDADFYFQRQVTIINPFVSVGSVFERVYEEFDAQFFPEGGNMVFGIPGKVAFRVVNRDGKGVDFLGAIIDSKNDTVVTFSPLKYGIGSFYFTPLKANKYKALIQFNDGSIRFFELPEPLEAGYTLQVKDTTNNMILVKVVTNTDVDGQNIHLLVHTRQILEFAEIGTIQNNQYTFLLDKNQLTDGVSHFTIFNHWMLPVCERLYFNGVDDMLKITVDTDKLEYKRRESVKIRLGTKNSTGVPVKSNLSVAAYKIDSLDINDYQDITTYLKVTSDLKGSIENPSFYFSDGNTIKYRNEIDNLMLTHGWRRFRWIDIIEGKSSLSHFRFIPELGGHIIWGFMDGRESQSPDVGVDVFFSVPKLHQLSITKTDKEGKFFIETTYTGSNKIVIQTRNKNSTLRIESPYSTQFSVVRIPDFGLTADKKDMLNTRSIHMQVFNAFSRLSSQSLSTDVPVPEFFGQPSMVYELDDYTRFPTMEEVLREYVPEIGVRKGKDGFRLVVIDPTINAAFNEEPLILLDGVPILDYNKFLEINPLKIKTLQVVTKKYFFAGLAFGGIINYKSYSADLAGLTFNDDFFGDYEILNVQREFFTPIYETPLQVQSTYPDARTVLYWNPNINTDKNGETEFYFYSSDISGRYRIEVQGFTSNGEIGSSSTYVNISNR